jgi:DNA polymerase I-like protein with 3'-5' exonuclease and polymerase domains
MFAPESDWRPPELSALTPWADSKRVAIDVETRDPGIKDLGPGVRRDQRSHYMVGYSYAIDGGPSFYVPTKHQGGDNVEDAGLAWDWLRNQAKQFTGEVVGANLSYDLDWLQGSNINFPNVSRFRDVLIAAPLLNELEMSYSLDAVLSRAGFETKEDSLLIEAAGAFSQGTGKRGKGKEQLSPKADLWRLPARYVGAYGEGDAYKPLELLRWQEARIEEQDLWQVWDLESDLLPILVKMRARGVRIDMDQLAKVERYSMAEELDAWKMVKRLTGVQLTTKDTWKAEALAMPLRAIGVHVGETKQGKPNIDQAFLSSIDHPVATAIQWARKVNKLRTTFANSVRRFIVGDRLHPTFNQVKQAKDDGTEDSKGARFGRISSDKPNIQQQPSRDEFANMWRGIYIPEDGERWCCADYSQQEPRLTTHYAALTDCTGAWEMVMAYRNNPDLDNHAFMEELTGVKRTYAKQIYLGLCYGMGPAKMCRQLRLPTEWAVRANHEVTYYPTQTEAREAAREYEKSFVWEGAGPEGREMLDNFHARAPFISELAKKCQNKASNTGTIRTLGGRVVHFPEAPDGSYAWVYRALNRLIQGSGGDQMKAAMVEADREGFELLIQVHDELNISTADTATAMRLGKLMANVVQLELPVKVDVELGPSWGELEEKLAA